MIVWEGGERRYVPREDETVHAPEETGDPGLASSALSSQQRRLRRPRFHRGHWDYSSSGHPGQLPSAMIPRGLPVRAIGMTKTFRLTRVALGRLGAGTSDVGLGQVVGLRPAVSVRGLR
jgi:hypothetical protein